MAFACLPALEEPSLFPLYFALSAPFSLLALAIEKTNAKNISKSSGS